MSGSGRWLAPAPFSLCAVLRAFGAFCILMGQSSSPQTCPAPVGLGLIQQQTQLLIHLGYIAEQPVEPLSQLIFGSFIQGALYIARADDKETAQEEIEHALLEWLNRLRIKP